MLEGGLHCGAEIRLDGALPPTSAGAPTDTTYFARQDGFATLTPVVFGLGPAVVLDGLLPPGIEVTGISGPFTKSEGKLPPEVTYTYSVDPGAVRLALGGKTENVAKPAVREVEWQNLGRLLVEEILRLPPRRVGDVPLFVTREGMPYIKESGSANAFDSLWQRFMDRVMAETKVKDRFQERDLRAKVASDSDTLQEASQRLGHADSAITQRVYRRKPVRVQPLIKGKGT